MAQASEAPELGPIVCAPPRLHDADPARADRAVAQACDRLIVRHRGRIVGEGPIAGIFANPPHDCTRAPMDAAPGRRWRRDAATPTTS
jgi:hypothetical protein